jgi:hypothetical protein
LSKFPLSRGLGGCKEKKIASGEKLECDICVDILYEFSTFALFLTDMVVREVVFTQ